MGIDDTTVVDIVEEWLADNDYDGLTDGCCSCGGASLMRCGIVSCRRCSAAYLFPCTRCAHLAVCDRTDGRDTYSTDGNWCMDFEEA